MIPADLVARVQALRREIRHLKSSIASRRRTLQAAAAELSHREEECRRFGIPLASDTTARVGDHAPWRT